MYINFWYPIVRSQDLGVSEPQKVHILGVDLVAFRDGDGNARVLSNTCVHRGGSLGGGWLKDGCVVCPYHGWEFEGDGTCKSIPSIGYDAKPPARAKIDSYPVQEKYGIVFAFLGDLPEAERPPIFEIEEYDQEGWRANEVLILDVDYYYERSIENGLDPAHNEFVHPTHGFSGQNVENYKVRDFDAVDQDQGWGTWFWHQFFSPPLDKKDWGNTRQETGDLWAGAGTHGPNLLITFIRPTDESEFRQYFFEAPVSETKTRIFFVNMRNFMLDLGMDGPIHERNRVVAQQDIDVLIEINPALTPESNIKEILMPADKCIASYRDWLKKFENQGWRIDVDAFRARNGVKTAFAIPSPARRESGNWVLEPIPLMSGETAQQVAAE